MEYKTYDMTQLDWKQVADIYLEGIKTGLATFAAEVSIYIGSKYKGQGVGTVLLQDLIKSSEENGFWTLQSGIIRENLASIKLHKKCGFREIGIREKVGKINNENWLDALC